MKQWAIYRTALLRTSHPSLPGTVFPVMTVILLPWESHFGFEWWDWSRTLDWKRPLTECDPWFQRQLNSNTWASGRRKSLWLLSSLVSWERQRRLPPTPCPASPLSTHQGFQLNVQMGTRVPCAAHNTELQIIRAHHTWSLQIPRQGNGECLEVYYDHGELRLQAKDMKKIFYYFLIAGTPEAHTEDINECCGFVFF